MNSMTGHGRGEYTAAGVRAVVECFSVNRKQSEVAVTTARELAWLEPLLRTEILKRISRGKVQVSVTVERGSHGPQDMIDARRAAAFLGEVRALQKKLGLEGAVSVDTILAAPGVLRSGTESADRLWPLVEKALMRALTAMLSMRAREGANLEKQFLGGISRLARITNRVRKLSPRVPLRHAESLRRRLDAADLSIDRSDPRLATEIALFAERCDISEELSRLESHHAQFRSGLDSDGAVGRTLEFIVQEMGREWNTTGAKANDAEISRLVVQAKAEIDKLREQLANIE